MTGGKFINVGLSAGVGNQLKPIWREKPPALYAKVIREARRWPIVLYDTDTRRAWLEDGASALLQITHSQLRADSFMRTYQPESIPDLRFACQSRKGGDEAMNILLDFHNQFLELSEEAGQLTLERKWNDRCKFLGEHPEQTLKLWSFRDQVRENFELLAQMSGYQRDPTSGLIMTFTGRERLGGWSFRDVLDERTLLEPKMVHLAPSGRGWEPFAREINALVLMGGDFGEIITPSPEITACCNWERMPHGHDLLATTYDYLAEIAEAKRADDFPFHLTPSILWHQPDSLFQGPCDTKGKPPTLSRSANGCDRIQVLLNSKLLEMLPSSRLGLVKHPRATCPAENLSPAVIFGRPRCKWLPGEPINIRPSPPPKEQIANVRSRGRKHLTRPITTHPTRRTRIPLPVFTHLSQGDNTNDESTSNGSRSRITQSTGASNARGLTPATSTLLTNVSDSEPAYELESKDKATAPTLQAAFAPEFLSVPKKSVSGRPHASNKLPIRTKNRINSPHVTTATTVGPVSDASHGNQEQLLQKSETRLDIPQQPVALSRTTAHPAVIGSSRLDGPHVARMKTLTKLGLRSYGKHLDDRGGLRKAYDAHKT